MINQGFWKKVKKPLFVLAPMADVTDFAFREMLAKYGAPDVFWTEFVSADGLCSRGKEKLMIDLKFSVRQKPIVAQIFTANPEHARRAAELVAECGFDGIDLNFGCPDRKVEKQGAGAVLMKDPTLAQKIILETKKGAGKLPVSVKTRIGYAHEEINTWLPKIFEMEPAAITVHLRTRKEMSKVPAHWELMPKIVLLRDTYFQGEKIKPLLLGNGDVKTLAAAKEKEKKYDIDGVMVGRGVFGNPWFFNTRKKIITDAERMCALYEHTALFEKTFQGVKQFAVMKKHFKSYTLGMRDVHGLRAALMGTKSSADFKKVLLAHGFMK